ncbi:MAG: SRPBCC domain-containing protein [Anaerolineales bacterium]|nr:SRPBCC domain-containing protein [Anaerolineales bacterium]
MSDQNYTVTLVVDKTPEEVFAAINDVRGWWTGEVEGETDKPDAEFTYRYDDAHRSTHKITEFIPGEKVVWHTINSHLNFVKNKTEWNGTDILFEITRQGNQTELRFTHFGLTPAIQCYGDCSGAWGFYINESLHNLIMTGKKQPNTQEP